MEDLVALRKLGHSGLSVSKLCLGAMMFGDQTPQAQAREIVADAASRGINFIDTADSYARGLSESIVGAAIGAQRERWVLATKVSNPDSTLGAAARDSGGLSRRWIFRACEASLRRLGTDWIDLYYLHREDRATPIEETVHAMGDLMRAGKIRYFGVSNHPAWRLAEIVSWCDRLGVPRPVAVQPYYNVLNRLPEAELLPACEAFGIGVVPYSPIARGVLTGKYSFGRATPPDSRIARRDKRILETDVGAIEAAERIETYANASVRGAMGFALAWLWASRCVASVIAGPRTMEQWLAYVDGLTTPYRPEDESFVDDLVGPGDHAVPGYRDPMYPVAARRLREAD